MDALTRLGLTETPRQREGLGLPPLRQAATSPVGVGDHSRSRRRLRTFGGVLGLGVLAAGCGGHDSGALPDPFAVAPVCTSGTVLDPNYQPSPEMSPGRACITCHVEENTASGEEGDAPVFTFAGTAYPTGHEPDYCSGAPAAGAVVELTDARGMTFQATVNDGGNFYDEIAGFTFPYTARITFNGKTRVMLEPQKNGDCNACHTQDGTDVEDPTDPAPGRILLP